MYFENLLENEPGKKHMGQAIGLLNRIDKRN